MTLMPELARVVDHTGEGIRNLKPSRRGRGGNKLLLIRSLYGDIQAALARGVSLHAIAKEIAARGETTMTGSTLRKYLDLIAAEMNEKAMEIAKSLPRKDHQPKGADLS